jgi:two-component sensor histidine kinase/CHASE3 domain sensor protein
MQSGLQDEAAPAAPGAARAHQPSAAYDEMAQAMPPTPPPREVVRLTLAASVPIICGLLLLLSICGAAVFLATISERQARAANQASLISGTANTLRVLISSAESAQRGYLLTQRAAYRAPFQSAVNEIHDSTGRLATMVAGDPDAMALVAHVTTDLNEKDAEMSDVLALADNGHPDAALATVNSDVGLRLMDRIMAELGALRRDAQQERSTALTHQSATTSLLIAAIGFAAVGALAMAALAVLQLREHLRQLRRREQERDELVATLEARVAQRTEALAQANERFQIALDSSAVTVFSQDTDLVYGWISRGTPDTEVSDIIGKTDAGFLPASAVSPLDRLKRGVLASGTPATAEVRIDYAAGTHWYDMTLVPTRDSRGRINGLVGGAVDISERKQYETHVRLLLREITHRSKNLLAVIQAIMRQTAAHSASVSDFTKRFSARLDALAGSLDLLVQEDWRGVTLADLVRSQLAHHADADSPQIELEGGRLQLPPDAAQNIGMALHELATNASKYGALSVPQGRVRVSWETHLDADGIEQCCLRWEERGGPLVTPPARRGFGQVVIERTVARAVGGRVTLKYPPTGLQWTLDFALPRANAADGH